LALADVWMLAARPGVHEAAFGVGAARPDLTRGLDAVEERQ